ncbi:MAG: signal recognition particle-docking protein FtsY [Syntrophaceae bacterium]
MFGNKEGGGFFDRLKKGLSKTRESLTRNFDQIIFGEKKIDQNLFDELEETFISADFGPAFTYDLIEEMKKRVKRDQLDKPEVLKGILKENIKDILASAENNTPAKDSGDRKLYTIMVVGVNGTGKTTTIGKLANNFKARGIPVAMAAADTFRAAAIEQLEVWSKRVGSPLFKQQMGSDPSAVVFDAVKAAPAQGAKVLIIDTAGRLHTKVNLMEELKKMKRIMGRELPGAPDEILLVLDATTGQNALSQAKMFKDEIGVTGIVLTKLDGTAKGGILIRIAKELQIPIQYIGIGEKIDDLRSFNREEFVNALFE